MKAIKILTFGFLLSTFASSQEIGISASQLWTDSKILQKPIGYGVYVSKNLSRYFSAKLSYEYIYNERNYYGTLSTWMDLNHVYETIHTSATANLWKLSLSLIPYHSEIFLVSGGFTLSTNNFSSDTRGQQTNRQSKISGEQKFGIGYVFLVQLFPIQSFPLAININGSREFLNRALIIATDVSEYQVSFYNSINISKFQIGLGYIIN